MGVLRVVLFSLCILTSAIGVCQQEPMPEKLSPDVVKALQEQEQRMRDSIAESNKHPGPKFNYLQCRADTQKWTSDPFDAKDARNLAVNTAIMVNGQFRSIPTLTPHMTVTGLLERIYEMSVCAESDADFEKQFRTYSMLEEAYKDERTFRYMYFLMKHNLQDQFIKEDAEQNK